MKNIVRYLLVFLPFLGLLDAGYLTWQHHGNMIPPCPAYFTFIDCGQVLSSQYSTVYGIPLALLGAMFYIAEAGIALWVYKSYKQLARKLLLLCSIWGFLFSVYLVYLQIIVIKAICLYCMGSAAINTLFFVIVLTDFLSGRMS